MRVNEKNKNMDSGIWLNYKPNLCLKLDEFFFRIKKEGLFESKKNSLLISWGRLNFNYWDFKSEGKEKLFALLIEI